MPKISVIIPIYNVEKYLDKCLWSVREQTFKDIEIICVDDCSPDESYLIVQRHAAEDPRVSLIRHEVNLGLGGARNTGIRAATAEYVASVDSDDFVAPDMLEVLWDATEKGTIDVVCCGFDKVDEAGNVLSLHKFSPHQVVNENNSLDIFSSLNPAFWNKLWRRSLYIDNNIFFPDHLYYEDMATTPRVLANAKSLKVIDDCLYHYLVRQGSITQTYSSRHMLDYFKVFEIIQSFLEEKKLAKRYSNEFKHYIDLGVRFHSHRMIESNMRIDELEQNLRHFLMLKIAFFEYHDLIKFMHKEKLMTLLETAKCKQDLL